MTVATPVVLGDVVLPGREGRWDLALADGRVTGAAPAGTARRPGAEVVDGGGRWALPGFVDAHVHGEAAVLDPDVQLALLRQGVTTVVLGQDGVSLAPSPPDGHDATGWAQDYFAAINGHHPTFGGGSVAALLDTWDRATPVNTAYLAPHGTLRVAVLGRAQREATEAEVESMAALLEQALRDGACGFSTGLEYAPASSASRAELLALCRVAASAGVPHVSHMRGYEDRTPTAVRELVDLALQTGVATHVSHLHGPLEVVRDALTAAGEAGAAFTFDSYPYLSGCSILSMVALPPWVPVTDVGAALAVLAPPDGTDVRADLLSHLESLAPLWPGARLASVPGALEWAEGLTPVQVADRLGSTVPEAVLRLLVASRLRASVVFRQPPGNTPAAVRALLDDPRHLGGSDAIYLGGSPHPRGWGAFARMVSLGLHELGGWDAADVVEHLSARAARLFGLTGRGGVEHGAVADVVLLDPVTVRDTASYDDPRRLAEGVQDVWVGGVPVLRDGALTGATPGRALRRGVPDPRGGTR
ncbi:N-acyl-D-amino-acid deacylase family protein [Auraticoccus monumenti]|nr:amidohydrolase family protein [Auraticoccus monumenti]